jgi:hypothetical protein
MKKNNCVLFLLLIIAVLLASCGSVRPYVDRKYTDWETRTPVDTASVKYSIYLIGDAGQATKDGIEPTFKLLQSMLYTRIDTVTGPDGQPTVTYQSDPNGTIVFMGDNIYYKGLPDENDNDRKEMERRLKAQLDVVKYYKGNKFFVPGNHDWDEQGKDGLEKINRQEKFVEEYLGSGNTFLPSKGCPGPAEVHLGNDIVLVLIDSQWWLHKFDKPVGPENGCNVNDQFELIVKLEDILDRNKGKHIMICQHHPLFTNGNHGGFYTLKDYIFPITIVRPKLFIPLPVIGAIYPLARKYGLSPQDMQHPEYKKLRQGMLSAIEKEKSTVFAAGHEHSLQLFKENEVHHIVSGSGCKDSYVAKGNDAIFSHEHKGFVRVNYYTNGQAWAEFWEPVGDGSKGKMVFRTALYSLTNERPKLPEDFECRDSTIVVTADAQFQTNAVGKTVFGEHYRQEWATPVRVHLLDMKCYANGLTPIKKGGGRQTTSIRLMGGDSIQYTLRTISKDPASLLPQGLRETFAEDILQDQMSSAHPYGALVIPRMAKALSLYHLKPHLVFVPMAPQLGPYLDDIGGKLAFIEIRPDEDLRYFADFGYSRNIISTRNMYANLREDMANTVDQRMFLKARLFDMLIGDWDRHEDQWRWAEFRTSDGLLYKPIPRDRDQVFSKYDGIFPYLVRKVAVKNFHNFTEGYEDVLSLGVSAQNLDRTLLTKLSMMDWIEIADSIKLTLTDSVIIQAVKDLPPEIFAISGEDLIKKLKSRRDEIHQAAIEYYRYLARVVDVVGSSRPEFFLVERLNNRETRVIVYKMNSDRTPGQKVYDRIFRRSETKEIRVYAMNGRDSIMVTGKVDTGIKVRVVGGLGYDVIIDSSEVKGRRKNTIVYDTEKENNTVVKGPETKSKLTSTYWVNNYNPQDFRYTKLSPRFSAEFNVDDGLFLGGGLSLKRQGFRKDPYQSVTKLVGNYAFRTGSFNVKYSGAYYSLLGRNWDLVINSRFYGPKYVLNYFGQGNESQRVPSKQDIDFYRVRLERFEFTPYVQHRLSSYFSMGIGPHFETNKVQTGANKFVSSDFFAEDPDLQRAHFIGSKFFALIDVRDNDRNPTRGSKWRNEVNYFYELGGPTQFTNLNTDLAFYYSPNQPATFTIAMRIGAGKNIGSYKFYQANFLGGSSNLRGYRRTRFAGRSMAYTNLEGRLRFYKFRTPAFTGTWNLMAFADVGRVWYDGEESRKWHLGYGPGIGVNVYDLFLLSFYYGLSGEENRFTVKTGWFF